MADRFPVAVRTACDDLHSDPGDPVARARLRELLGSSAGGTLWTSEREQRRRVKIACDDLYLDPLDADAQQNLLMLLTLSPPSHPPSAA